jgi:hypothetical protein
MYHTFWTQEDGSARIEIQGLQAQDFQSHGERLLELVQFQ